jgi:chromatin remodeling complex protein RSC6
MALPKIVKYIQKLMVKYTVKESEESPYDPEFVDMVQESRKGKSTRINPENIWENIL